MFRKIALVLAVFAILGTIGSTIPGLTSSTAVACTNPSCVDG